MDDSDKKQFAEVLIATGEVYDKAVSSALARLYFQDLQEYPVAAVLGAFAAHRKDPDRGRFFPKPADLIDKLKLSTEDEGIESWESVLKMASNWRNARHINPKVEAAVRAIGGWQRIGMSDRDQIGFLRREFLAAYGMNSAKAHVHRIASGEVLSEVEKLSGTLGINKPTDAA